MFTMNSMMMHHPEGLVHSPRASPASPVSPLGLDGMSYHGMGAVDGGAYGAQFGWPNAPVMHPKTAPQGMYPPPAFQVAFQQPGTQTGLYNKHEPTFPPLTRTPSPNPFMSGPNGFQAGPNPLHTPSPPPNSTIYLQQCSLALAAMQNSELLAAAGLNNPQLVLNASNTQMHPMTLLNPAVASPPLAASMSASLSASLVNAMGTSMSHNLSRSSTPPIGTAVPGSAASNALMVRALAAAQALNSRPGSPVAPVAHAHLAERLAAVNPFGVQQQQQQPAVPTISALSLAASALTQYRSKSSSPHPDETAPDEVCEEEEDAIAKGAAAALEAAVKLEQATIKAAGGNKDALPRANSLRNVRGAQVVPTARRNSSRTTGRLRRCESMGDLWKGGSYPATRTTSTTGLSEADKVVRDAATALEEAVARERAATLAPEQRAEENMHLRSAKTMHGHHTQSLGSLLSTTISLPDDLLGFQFPEDLLDGSEWLDIGKGDGGLGMGQEGSQDFDHQRSSFESESRLNGVRSLNKAIIGGSYPNFNHSMGSSHDILDMPDYPTDLSFGANPFVPFGSSSGSGSSSDLALASQRDSQEKQRSLSANQYHHGLDFLDDDEDFSKMLGELSVQSLMLDGNNMEY